MAVYHPQTNLFVERFNGTLKSMLCCCTQAEPWKWDLLVPPLLFAVRENPQVSLGYFPFELTYGCQPHSLMDVIKEGWKAKQVLGIQASGYVKALRQRLQTAKAVAQENLTQAQEPEGAL